MGLSHSLKALAATTLVSLTVLLSGAGLPAARGAPPGLPSGVEVYVKAGSNARIPVTAAGQVFDVGATKDGSGNCQLPGGNGVEVGANVTNPVVVSVTTRSHFDDTCRLVFEVVSAQVGGSGTDDPPPTDGVVTTPQVTPETVTESGRLASSPTTSVRARRAGAGTRSPGTRHRHNGWAKSTVFEQFGVTATEVYSYLTYYQATSPTKYVDQGYNYLNSYCLHSSFPGWSTDRCVFEVLDLTGPRDVAVKVDARFSHLLATYSQSSRFRATKSGDWNGTCNVYDGTLPPFWDEECTRNRSAAF